MGAREQHNNNSDCTSSSSTMTATKSLRVALLVWTPIDFISQPLMVQGCNVLVGPLRTSNVFVLVIEGVRVSMVVSVLVIEAVRVSMRVSMEGVGEGVRV
ncbi:hypothetical protein ACFE04_023129 [Oxalis oulophora]